MKIAASKKTIVILSVCFISLLLSGLSLLYKDVISNGIKHGRWFTLGEDDKLLDDCEWEREGIDIKIKCKGFLASIHEDSSNNLSSANFILLNEKVFNVRGFSTKLETKNLQWKNPYEIYDKYIPVYIDIVYKNRLSPKHNLSTMSLNIIPDEMLDDLILGKFDINHITTQIITQEEASIRKNNYYIVESRKELGPPDIVYIQDLILKESSLIGNEKIKMLFTGIIKNTEIQMEVISENIFYQHEGEDGRPIEEEITHENYLKIPKETKFFAVLLSLSEEDEKVMDEILEKCNNNPEYIALKALCNFSEEKIRSSIINDREQYLKSFLENPREIKLEKPILYLLSSL